MASMYVPGYRQQFSYKRYRVSTTKHRPQNPKVRAKGIESIWIQICSSLLYLLRRKKKTENRILVLSHREI